MMNDKQSKKKRLLPNQTKLKRKGKKDLWSH
jgi:hypothetical protein